MYICTKFQGGDKLTLSLGGTANGAVAGTVTNNSEKLINIDPVISSSTTKSPKHVGSSSLNPPPPPPRISSDPNNPINLARKLTNGDNNKSLADTLPVSVTHFSPSVNGFGLEKETIFTEENGMSGQNHENSIGNATPKSKNTNPFLTNSSGSSPENDTTAIYRSQSRKENNNYENVRMFSENEATGNPFTSGKFNTIGRSNPFSSVKGNNSNRNNPFLDTNGSSFDSDNNTKIQTNSPDASIDPTPIIQPAVLKQSKEQTTLENMIKSSINGLTYPENKISKTVSRIYVTPVTCYVDS